ncbi:MAG TPA: hypothetical protein VFE50_15580 [Cyclobacteriaceae bacterium]|nr:hypothetical protein [Cyclobacteriaceae bacterium]
MIRKFFPLDKNYLLEEAQLLSQDDLLSSLVEVVKAEYELRYNPLGVCDDLILKIRMYKSGNLKPLYNFYQNLAGIYRYRYGDNQLEFSWDGIDHSEKYKSEWREFFLKQIITFSKNELFLRAVLDLTVFLPENRNAQLAENRMNHFMLQTFEVKIHKQRGIVAVA